MTFLNGLLAFGALAFAIPLVIHLLNRSKFQTVDWGAMHLLESVIRVNHRRFQIQQLLLLLVRCAIPVLLALCLAIPVLTNWQALPKDTPSSVALLIDDSYSMDAVDDDSQTTLMAGAVADSQQIVAALPRGSEAKVILSGGRPQALQATATVDLQQVDNDLKKLLATAGANDVSESLKAATIAVAEMNNARREVVLMSDFQRDDWQSVSADVLTRFREQWQALPAAPAITLIPLGRRDTSDLQNVSVESLHSDRPTVGVGQEVRLRATIRNHGDQVRPAMRLRLKVNNDTVAATTANLDAGATTQLLLTHRFEQAGSQVVHVELDCDDALASDNHQFATIEVLQTIDVVLVDGKPSNQPLQGETGFLSVALSPFAFGRQPLADLVKTRTIRSQQLDEAVLADARVVVLANVSRLDDRQVDWLNDFVRAGNSLMIFAGDQISLDWYHEKLGAQGADLLPMTLGERVGQPQPSGGGGEAAEAGKHLVAQFFEHPSMQLFNETSSGSLADADVFAWYPLLPISDTDTDATTDTADNDNTDTDDDDNNNTDLATASGATVVARLETGDTLMAERACGDGVVLLVGTSANLQWSNLPMQPVFVPLVQEWVSWMATRGLPPRNVAVGQTAVVHWSEDTDRTWQWLSPDGALQDTVADTQDHRQTFQFPSLRQPGVYALVGASPDVDRQDETIYVAATADPAESHLLRLSDAEIAEIADALGATVADSGAAYLQLDNTRRFGREIWRPLLLALLAMMVLEVFLQQYFAGVRR